MNNFINDKELENIIGGTNTDPALNNKYEAGQTVKFLNPNDSSVELVGTIRSVNPELGADGFPLYTILVSQGSEADFGIGRPYRVSEQNIIGLAETAPAIGVR